MSMPWRVWSPATKLPISGPLPGHRHAGPPAPLTATASGGFGAAAGLAGASVTVDGTAGAAGAAGISADPGRCEVVEGAEVVCSAGTAGVAGTSSNIPPLVLPF